MKRILLVEDDQILGATIYERLIESNYTVTWSQSAADAAAKFKDDHFDLVIFDINLPDGDGIELAARLQKIREVPFVFMTAKTTASDRLKAYEVGAQEFVPKPFHFRELLIKIRHVLHDHSINPMLSFKDIALDFPALTLKVSGNTYNLTSTEASLLRLLIEKAPNSVSRNQIIDNVWGVSHVTNVRTIDNMISKLRTLLGAERAEWLQSVRGVGYRLSDQITETKSEQGRETGRL